LRAKKYGALLPCPLYTGIEVILPLYAVIQGSRSLEDAGDTFGILSRGAQ